MFCDANLINIYLLTLFMLKLKKILALSLIPQYLLIQFISFYPNFIESVYSNHIYIFISSFFRSISSNIPYAIGDVLYIIIGVFSIYWLVINIKKPKRLLIELFACISIAYFFFNLSWGLNYYRIPINNQIENTTYSYEDLNKFSLELIKKINQLHFQLTSNDSIKAVLPYNFQENARISISNYHNLEKKHNSQYYGYKFIDRSIKNISDFNKKGNKNNVKESMLSYPLTYMGFSGYLNPFTHEYNINSLIPDNSKPMVISHEIAHEIGFSSEMEANFISYISLINSENIYYQYFGHSFALRQCLNELRKLNKENYNLYLSKINKGILENYKETFEFWNNYNNPFEPIIKNIYDKFLKANKVKSGIKSYNQSLSLILKYNKPYND